MVEKSTEDFIADAVKRLKPSWSERDKKMRAWYNILTLKDEMAQEGMESVVANDPRTGYNLGLHLMSSSIVAHKIQQEGMTDAEVGATSKLEGFITNAWDREESRYRSGGHRGLKNGIVGSMLATGWYSLFAMVDKNRIWFDLWDSIQVYPRFGYDGLAEVVRIIPLTAQDANYLIKSRGWDKGKSAITKGVNMSDYWGFDDDGDVVNGIVIGQNVVKELVKEPDLSKVKRLPVFLGPVGGLPDSGAIVSGKKWQEHYGESIIATNEGLTKNYNRLLTFAQQLVRDTSDPRWLELSSGDDILDEERLFKRGAIFRGEPGDEVTTLPIQPIPPEIRTMTFDYQNMVQRGLFPWSMYGNLQMQLSYLAMANIASSAMQTLNPYMDALSGLYTDVDNFVTNMMLENGYRPHKFKKPDGLPDSFDFNVQVDIEIPGYMTQRATVARMLNPGFKLPVSWITDRMFPEIRDSVAMNARSRSEDAISHPKFLLVEQIRAARGLAQRYLNIEKETSKLYSTLAKSLEAELSAQSEPTPQATSPEMSSALNEVQPSQATEPNRGYERP